MVGLAMSLIGATLALGAWSALMFVWQWTVAPPSQLIAILLLLCSICGAVSLITVVVRRTRPVPIGFDARWGLLLVAVLFAAYWMARHIQLLPYGHTDAWAIWNGHARFFFRDGGRAWRRLFTSERA